jgi:N-acetylglucosaminyldiphosphoundecaprenol N-acetyl-beta-D-mannosaminyltransferase
MMCRRDPEMRKATTGAALILPDGVGIILAARLLGYGPRHRATGPELMLKLCDLGRKYGFRHFFYGGAEGVAERLARRLGNLYPGLTVAGACCPPFRSLSAEEDLDLVKQINDARPDVLWVGLGAPKQEKWMVEHAGRISAAAMIGVGAAFDFHSGNVKWAPPWVRKLGLEWAYRLVLEPKRMWRRNVDSPLFLLLAGLRRLQIHSGGRASSLAHTRRRDNRGQAESACSESNTNIRDVRNIPR